MNSLRTDHPSFEGRRVAHLANPDTTIGELEHVGRLVAEHAPNSEVIVSLDLHVFAHARAPKPGFELSLFSPSANPIDFWLDKWVSQNSFRRSRQVLTDWLTDDRYSPPNTPSAENILESFATGPELFGCYARGPEENASFERLVDHVSRTRHATIVILPVHAVLLEAIALRGLWTEIEDWKRLLASAGSERVVVWDFFVHSAITTSPLPKDGPPPDGPPSAPASPWFIDPSHATFATGDLVLDWVAGRQDDPRAGAFFGSRLEPSTVEAHLEAAREARARYRAEHPEEIRWVESVVGTGP
ncbi:MAG: hypothetical protein KDC38_07715, partial [Planctomycetes bacterium]|nr:hypothetical protein [Planctomycetota bacterium]